MKGTKSELRFRHILNQAMKDQWKFIWHEDRIISPGVPDLHFCFEPDGHKYDLGWLELKSVDSELSKTTRIRVEPSQHQFIRRWRQLTPIYFLIHVKGMVYLVSSEHHSVLPGLDSTGYLAPISVARMRSDEMQYKLATALKDIVRRHDSNGK